MERGPKDVDPINVLVVDADAHSLQTTLSLLVGKDQLHISDTARSGYEAVAKSYACRPQVVLMEIEMETPRAGLMALREITGAMNHCRVVVYTAVQTPDVICAAFADGAVNYLTKPASTAALVRAVVQAGTGVYAIASDGGETLLKEYRRLYRLQDNLSGLLKVAMSLTASELSILRLLVNGMQPGEIERIRFIEHSTMKSHLSHIIKKFDVDGISQVVETLRAFRFFEFLDD